MRLVDRTSVLHIKRRSFLGQAVLILLAVQLLFLASFTSFEVPVASKRNLQHFAQRQLHYAANAVPAQYKARVEAALPVLKEPLQDVRHTTYTPLLAVAVFVGYVLGPLMGPAACAIFLAVGLFGPCVGLHPFAGGGGVNYYLEPGFGYLCALIGAAWVAGFVTAGKRTTASQLCAVFCGLTVTHLTGLVYLLGSCLASYLIDGSRASLAWQPWVFELARNMTWYPLPYDAITCTVMIGLGYPFRWLAATLVAPDMGAKLGGDTQARPARPVRTAREKVQPTIVEEFV